MCSDLNCYAWRTVAPHIDSDNSRKFPLQIVIGASIHQLKQAAHRFLDGVEEGKTFLPASACKKRNKKSNGEEQLFNQIFAFRPFEPKRFFGRNLFFFERRTTCWSSLDWWVGQGNDIIFCYIVFELLSCSTWIAIEGSSTFYRPMLVGSFSTSNSNNVFGEDSPRCFLLN